MTLKDGLTLLEDLRAVEGEITDLLVAAVPKKEIAEYKHALSLSREIAGRLDTFRKTFLDALLTEAAPPSWETGPPVPEIAGASRRPEVSSPPAPAPDDGPPATMRRLPIGD